jgi:hypothetical protein
VLTVLTFLWNDPQYRHNDLYLYDAGYVNRMRHMLARHLTLPHELVCCTDMPEGLDGAIRVVPLPPAVKSLGECNPKLYAFHPDAARLFGPRILLIDLDAVIVGNMAALASRTERFIAWSVRDHAPGRFNTSLVLMDAGAFPKVWTTFDRRASGKAMSDAGFVGEEQDWVSFVVGDAGQRWPRSGAGIEAFQPRTGWTLPESARIVFFPGRRSPAMPALQRRHPWIPRAWR